MQTMIDVGHSRLAYRRIGQGPDLVFVHGWPLHSATFRHVVSELSDAFTCHLIDLPGAGESTWSEPTRFSLQGHAATLEQAIQKLGLGQYMLVAHDSGAGIARLLAANNPAVLGLLCGPTEIPGHDPWLVAMYRLTQKLPGGGRLIGLLMGIGLILRSPLGFAGCFTDPGYALGAFRGLFIAPLVADPRRLEPQLRMLASFTAESIGGLEHAHGQITVPVCMVLGTDDTIFPMHKSKAMLRQFGGPVDHVVIEGAKAFLHEDHPVEFAAQVRDHAALCLARAAVRAAS